MKFKNVIQLLALLLFTTFAQASIKTVAPQTLLQLIENKQAPLIIDVRSAAEFAQGHIQGAINISYEKIAKNPLLNGYKEQDIIIYCRSGRRAQVAAQALQKKGFKQLIDLSGHIIAWQKLRYPLFSKD